MNYGEKDNPVIMTMNLGTSHFVLSRYVECVLPMHGRPSDQEKNFAALAGIPR